ncbi:hypothetical protein [Spirosoma pulveris]
MHIIQIPVPYTAAQRFQSLSEQQQTLVSQLVADCIDDPIKLAEAMDYLRFRAEKASSTSNGLG